MHYANSSYKCCIRSICVILDVYETWMVAVKQYLHIACLHDKISLIELSCAIRYWLDGAGDLDIHGEKYRIVSV